MQPDRTDLEPRLSFSRATLVPFLASVGPFLLAAAASGWYFGIRERRSTLCKEIDLSPLGARLVREEVWHNLAVLGIAAVPVALWMLLGSKRSGAVRRRCILAAAYIASWTPLVLGLHADWRVSRVRRGWDLPTFVWDKQALVVWGIVVAVVIVAAFLALRSEPSPDPNRPGGLSKLGVASFFIALLVASGAELRYRMEPSETGSRTNVIFVTWDSTRADRLSAYGSERPTTPALEQFARDAVVFDRAYSQFNWTRPSYSSMLTSNSMLATLPGFLKRDDVTLAEMLANAGYNTRGVVQNPNISSAFDFDQGFNAYVEFHPSDTTAAVLERASAELEQLAASDAPFFLFAHFEQPHWPYRRDGEHVAEFTGGAEPSVDTEQLQRWMRDELETWDPEAPDAGRKLQYMLDLYDADIREADDAFAELMRTLDELGHREDTIVVFNSDHGDEFFERGSFGHGRGNVFQELTRIPLMFRIPSSHGVSPQRVSTPVENLDVVPTLLGLLGLESPGHVQGRDLLSTLSDDEPRVSLSHGNGTLIVRNAQFALSVDLTGAEPMSLFDASDPAELRRLEFDEGDARLAPLLAAVEEWHKQQQKRQQLNDPVEAERLDPDVERQLRELGYL